MKETVRRRLVQASPGRVSRPLQGALLCAAVVLLACGCGRATIGAAAPEFAVAYPGEEAGAIARARAANLQDKIRLYDRARADLEQQRDAYLKDATALRNKSADVWSDPGIPEHRRASMASQYSESAREAAARADRVQERIDSYTSEIGFLEGKRQDHLIQAAKYENMVEPLP